MFPFFGLIEPPLPVRRTRATAALTEPLVIIPSNILKAIIKDEPLDQIDESTSGGTTLDPFQDTTDRHKSHLFDPNFRICSGQVKPKDDVIKVSSKTTSPGRKTNSDKKSSSSSSRKNLKEYKVSYIFNFKNSFHSHNISFYYLG